ncbi:hypothetical protein JZ751_007408 [Albula glossodonta]|uniref:C2H2-type domain-containing protein n=1 Tax=Albula glossodonta TaxID=121402 RepID=A0A8T2NDN5_9TELE|nr:hypothetical protein JZ751_007408 [Albula glossodonta]
MSHVTTRDVTPIGVSCICKSELGECGTKMAAVHSPEPQRHQVEPPNSCLEDDPGGEAETPNEGSTPSPPSRVADPDDSSNAEKNESNCESKVSGDGVQGLCSSKTEISIVHQTNNAAMVPNLVIDLTASEAEAQMHPVVSCESQREFEWSEAEEESDLPRGDKEYEKNNVSELEVDASPKMTENGVESSPGVEETEAEKMLSSQARDKMSKDISEELVVGESEVGVKAEAPVKQRKSRLICQECGKLFTRRETFNLHRHFHTHQDELASLTCKECGLTFQHRSSLIKHRSEHKEKAAPPLVLERRTHSFREGRSPQCEHCGQTFLTLGKLRCHPCQRAPEKPYRCPLCRKEFQYRVSINAHMQTHSLESPFRCLECNKGFQCSMALRIHQRSHAALKPFECPECGLVFRHRSIMEDHRRKHSEDRLHRCGICGKRFKYGSLLHQHQFLHTGQKPFKCPDCGKKFAFAQNMRAHWRQHRRQTYACPRCPLAFQDLAGLQEHVQSHQVAEEAETFVGVAAIPDVNNGVGGEVQEEPHTCPLCFIIIPDLVDLKAHMLVHEAEEGFGGAGLTDVNMHMDMNNGESLERPYTCPRCPLVLPDLSSLQAHIIIHEVPAPVEEEEEELVMCRKGYSEESELQRHMVSHTGDKPHKCQLCNKSFGLAYLLRDHLNTHTGERPHRCQECNKSFPWLSSLLVHQKIHARKRQGVSQPLSLPLAPQSRGRGGRGRGSRSRRAGRWASGWPRWAMGEGIGMLPPPPPPYSVAIASSPGEWPARLAPPPPVYAAQFSCHEQWQQQQWRSEGAALQQQVQKRQQPLGWVDPPVTTQVGTAGIPYGPHHPARMDGTALWGFQSPPAEPHATLSSSGKPGEGQEQKQKQQQQLPPSIVWADAPSSASVGQGVVRQESPRSAGGNGAATWAFQTSPPVSQTLSSPKKMGNGPDQQQQLRGWTNSPGAAKVGSSAVPFEESPPRRLTGGAIFNFEISPPGPKTMSSPNKLGEGVEQQQQQQQHKTQQPGMTDSQAHPDRTTPALSLPPPLLPAPPPPPPPPQSLALPPTQPIPTPLPPNISLPLSQALSLTPPKPHRPEGAGSLPPPTPVSAHNSYLTQQRMIRESLPCPPPRPLPQLQHPRLPKHHQPLPFARNPLLQCMICGCSLPRELDLHLHYMQHAQGEI